MESKKQTAVEWLVDQLFKHGYFDGNNPLTYEHLVDLKNQAKLIEREHIIEAYRDGRTDQSTRVPRFYNRSSALYYTLTYE